MNPDTYGVRLSMGWGVPHPGPSVFEKRNAALRRERLHAAAVARRRKAKRGGKR